MNGFGWRFIEIVATLFNGGSVNPCGQSLSHEPRFMAETLTTWIDRATIKERGDDLYETPPEAVHALLRAEKLPEAIWEPACGPGSIVRVLRSAGHRVYATDLVDYGLDDSEFGVDFLMERQPGFYIGAIVTNPPFKLAEQFVAHALKMFPKVVMLLRLTFIESDKRRAI